MAELTFVSILFIINTRELMFIPPLGAYVEIPILSLRATEGGVAIRP